MVSHLLKHPTVPPPPQSQSVTNSVPTLTNWGERFRLAIGEGLRDWQMTQSLRLHLMSNYVETDSGISELSMEAAWMAMSFLEEDSKLGRRKARSLFKCLKAQIERVLAADMAVIQPCHGPAGSHVSAGTSRDDFEADWDQAPDLRGDARDAPVAQQRRQRIPKPSTKRHGHMLAEQNREGTRYIPCEDLGWLWSPLISAALGRADLFPQFSGESPPFPPWIDRLTKLIQQPHDGSLPAIVGRHPCGADMPLRWEDVITVYRRYGWIDPEQRALVLGQLERVDPALFAAISDYGRREAREACEALNAADGDVARDTVRLPATPVQAGGAPPTCQSVRALLKDHLDSLDIDAISEDLREHLDDSVLPSRRGESPALLAELQDTSDALHALTDPERMDGLPGDGTWQKADYDRALAAVQLCKPPCDLKAMERRIRRAYAGDAGVVMPPVKAAHVITYLKSHGDFGEFNADRLVLYGPEVNLLKAGAVYILSNEALPYCTDLQINQIQNNDQLWRGLRVRRKVRDLGQALGILRLLDKIYDDNELLTDIIPDLQDLAEGNGGGGNVPYREHQTSGLQGYNQSALLMIEVENIRDITEAEMDISTRVIRQGQNRLGEIMSSSLVKKYINFDSLSLLLSEI